MVLRLFYITWGSKGLRDENKEEAHGTVDDTLIVSSDLLPENLLTV